MRVDSWHPGEIYEKKLWDFYINHSLNLQLDYVLYLLDIK